MRDPDPARRGAASRCAGVARRRDERARRPTPAFLMEMMEQREALAEAQRSAGPRRGARAGRRRSKRARDGVEASARRRASHRAAERRATLAALVPLLGELRFYRRFLDEVSAIEDELRSMSMSLLEIFDPKAPPRPIGIDLGTTNSLVAYVQNERPVAIADCDRRGARCRASCTTADAATSSSDGGAALRAAEHPRDTIVSVKRFMGRGADDPETRRLGPYEFVAAERRARRTSCASRSPAGASSRRSRSAPRSCARSSASPRTSSAASAARSSPCPRTSTTRSARPRRTPARLAGLEVLRLLNEPTAAALAYGLEKKQNGTFAVYDLGGGTFDVTILVLDDGVFQVQLDRRRQRARRRRHGSRARRTSSSRALGVRRDAARRRSSCALALDAARKVKHALTDATRSRSSAVVGEATRAVTRHARALRRARSRRSLERTGVACRRALRTRAQGRRSSTA